MSRCPARWFTAVLATLVLAGSIYLLIRPPFGEIRSGSRDRIPALEKALQDDLASARRWCDLGEALADAGRLDDAAYCYRRAMQLAPGNALVQIRAANFYVINGQPSEMLPVAKRVLSLTRTYDAVLFTYFDRLVSDPGTVIAQMRGNRDALTAYLNHAIAGKKMPFAAAAWDEVSKMRWADDKLAAAYVNALVADQQYARALDTWIRHLGGRAGDYPATSLLFNGGFETEPAPCVFDWMVQNTAGATVSRDPSGKNGAALRIDFDRTRNLDYRHVGQATFLEPGRYRLRASLKAANITTNEGPYVLVTTDPFGDLTITSDPVTGSRDWAPIELTFTVADHPRLVYVRICRRRSLKVDNKIGGTLWVDDIRLERES